MGITATAVDPRPHETGVTYTDESAVTHRDVVNELYDCFAAGTSSTDPEFLAAISNLSDETYVLIRNHLADARQVVNNPELTPG